MAKVTLRPLREDEYPAWAEAHIRGYAEGMTAFAGLSEEEATAKAARDHAFVLPHGLATEGLHIYALEAEDGRTVGTIFLGARDGGAWVYDVTVAEAERGRGYGRAAMLAIEDEARRLGFAKLGLNVWGGNEIARSLYRSLDFAEVSVGMSKPL